MRIVLLCCALIGIAAPAFGQDLDQPRLRGSNVFEPEPPPIYRWAGFYGGGHLGKSSAIFDYSKATNSLVAYALRNTALETEEQVSQWQVLDKSGKTIVGYGGFVGFNVQWDDVTLGLELNYNGGPVEAIAVSTPITRAVSAGGSSYVVTVDGTATMNIIDYGTVRAVGGYAYGRFHPFAMLGVALGRADYSKSANINLTENGVPFAFSGSESRNGAFIYGLALGLGFDVAITPNIFLRGEYELVQFAPLADISATINSFRVGVGVKF